MATNGTCPSFGLSHDSFGRLVLIDSDGLRHVGVEPLPDLYARLVAKYAGRDNVTLHALALSDTPGEATFQPLPLSGVWLTATTGGVTSINADRVRVEELPANPSALVDALMFQTKRRESVILSSRCSWRVRMPALICQMTWRAVLDRKVRTPGSELSIP